MKYANLIARNESVVRLRRAGLSLADIAQAVGLSESYISKLLRTYCPEYKARVRRKGAYSVPKKNNPLNRQVKNVDEVWKAGLIKDAKKAGAI